MQREESQQCMVDEDFDLGIENGRRESNVGNDDDYDYALELLEDDEYRYNNNNNNNASSRHVSLPCPILFCHVLSCLVLSCPAL
jgi:hypothetical protein